MSNSSLVQYTKIAKNYSSRNGKKISKITIHHMAGCLSVETCGNVFQTREASSNYGIGTDGRIALYVDEAKRSWASSNRANDEVAVTIEVANSSTGGDWPVSDLCLSRLIELCVDICKRNGIERLNYTGDASGNLTRHNMFIATTCPGAYLQSKFPYIADEVNKRLGGSTPTPASTTYSKTDFIKDVQRATGAAVDGIAGPETLSKTITISKTKNNKHAVVKAVQKYLISLGYDVGSYGADGIFGSATDKAVRKYQSDHGCVFDGEITARNKTWKKLLGLL